MSIRTSVEFVPELRVDWEAGIYHPVDGAALVLNQWYLRTNQSIVTLDHSRWSGGFDGQGQGGRGVRGAGSRPAGGGYPRPRERRRRRWSQRVDRTPAIRPQGAHGQRR